jgi:hypothetical protein
METRTSPRSEGRIFLSFVTFGANPADCAKIVGL